MFVSQGDTLYAAKGEKVKLCFQTKKPPDSGVSVTIWRHDPATNESSPAASWAGFCELGMKSVVEFIVQEFKYVYFAKLSSFDEDDVESGRIEVKETKLEAESKLVTTLTSLSFCQLMGVAESSPIDFQQRYPMSVSLNVRVLNQNRVFALCFEDISPIRYVPFFVTKPRTSSDKYYKAVHLGADCFAYSNEPESFQILNKHREKVYPQGILAVSPTTALFLSIAGQIRTFNTVTMKPGNVYVPPLEAYTPANKPTRSNKPARKPAPSDLGSELTDISSSVSLDSVREMADEISMLTNTNQELQESNSNLASSYDSANSQKEAVMAEIKALKTQVSLLKDHIKDRDALYRKVVVNMQTSAVGSQTIMCLVCHKTRDCRFYPCNHSVYCSECAKDIMAKGLSRCSMCYEQIKEVGSIGAD